MNSSSEWDDVKIFLDPVLQELDVPDQVVMSVAITIGGNGEEEIEVRSISVTPEQRRQLGRLVRNLVDAEFPPA